MWIANVYTKGTQEFVARVVSTESIDFWGDVYLAMPTIDYYVELYEKEGQRESSNKIMHLRRKGD